jgi:glycosyltransferase involved in cell wall biosynthesis
MAISKIIILKPKESLNFSESINAGIRNSNNDKVFIANDDIIISKQTMERLADHCDENTITGPDSNCNVGWMTNHHYTIKGVPLIPAMLPKQIEGIVEDIYEIVPTKDNKPKEVDWLAFFATMVHRKTLNEVGLLDENLIYDKEDLLWCRQAKAKGKTFLYCFDSFCFHFGGVSRKVKHEELGMKHLEDNRLNEYYYSAVQGLRKTKPIEGFEDYLVSEDGIVISNKEWRGSSHRMLSLREKEDGYITAHLSKNSNLSNKAVHRLVAKAFIPNPENLPEVNHKNGIKDDNRVENLEWVSSSDNQKHAYDTGLREVVGTHPNHTITEEEVIFLRKIYKKGNISMVKLGELFGISKSNACRIVNGEDWSEGIKDKIVIGINCWDAWECWDETSLNKAIDPKKPSGIGGSETQIILLSRELSKLGYKVKIFNKCKEQHYDKDGFDVEYIIFSDFGEYSKKVHYDYFIASRYLDCFDVPFSSGRNFAMVHDVFLIMNHKNLHDVKKDRIEKYFCLSQRHKQFVHEYHDIPLDQIVVTSNGLDFTRFDKDIKKDRYQMIYSSSPDRGLELLLSLFPKVKEQVPEAKLDIYYGFENFRDQEYVKKMLGIIKNTKGVTYHGRVGQDELAEAFLGSTIWAYPTWFQETYCITALEAMASKCVPVTSSYWGLIDTVKDGGILLPMNDDSNTVLTPAYQDKWISECVSLFKDDDYLKEWQVKGLDRVKRFTWDKVASQWDQYFKNPDTWVEIQ